MGFLVNALYVVFGKSVVQGKVLQLGAESLCLAGKVRMRQVLWWGANRPWWSKSPFYEMKSFTRGKTNLNGQKVRCTRRSPQKGATRDLDGCKSVVPDKVLHEGQQQPQWSKIPLHDTKSSKRGNTWPWWSQFRCARQSPPQEATVTTRVKKSNAQDKVLLWRATTTLMVKSPLHETKSSNEGQSHGDLAGQSPLYKTKSSEEGHDSRGSHTQWSVMLTSIVDVT